MAVSISLLETVVRFGLSLFFVEMPHACVGVLKNEFKMLTRDKR